MTVFLFLTYGIRVLTRLFMGSVSHLAEACVGSLKSLQRHCGLPQQYCLHLAKVVIWFL